MQEQVAYQVGDHAADVPHGDEEPARAAACIVQFGVDRYDRAEQQQRLVDDVRTKVEQDPSARCRDPACWRVLLHPRLEPRDPPKLPGVDHGADGEKVGVETTVLVHRQRYSGPFRLLQRLPGGG